jgi:hypothetical protein
MSAFWLLAAFPVGAFFPFSCPWGEVSDYASPNTRIPPRPHYMWCVHEKEREATGKTLHNFSAAHGRNSPCGGVTDVSQQLISVYSLSDPLKYWLLA